MAKRFVKASGGCSAPAGKDPEAALARLGKMKLRQSDAMVLGEPNMAQLLISHPNHTGMQMDQISRHYVPAYFVNNIEVRYGDEPVLTVESDISLSEDPSIHFHFTPREPAELSVKVTDSKDNEFSRAWGGAGQRQLASAGATDTGGREDPRPPTIAQSHPRAQSDARYRRHAVHHTARAQPGRCIPPDQTPLRARSRITASNEHHGQRGRDHAERRPV